MTLKKYRISHIIGLMYQAMMIKMKKKIYVANVIFVMEKYSNQCQNLFIYDFSTFQLYIISIEKMEGGECIWIHLNQS